MWRCAVAPTERMLARITALSAFPVHKNHFQNHIDEPDSQCQMSDNACGGPFLQEDQERAGNEGQLEPDVKCRFTQEGFHVFPPEPMPTIAGRTGDSSSFKQSDSAPPCERGRLHCPRLRFVPVQGRPSRIPPAQSMGSADERYNL